jgi:hypothetical protein
MPLIQWPPERQAAFEVLSGRNAGASGCVLWATSAVDGLAYLDDLDTALDAGTRFVNGHDALVIDMAHARWAAGSAMTALDLCAAAIGFLYLPPRRRYYDMGNVLTALDKAVRNAGATSSPQRPGWPPRQGVRPWIVDVNVDADFQLIKAVRNPLTHRTLPRNLSITVGSGPQRVDRTMFQVEGQPNPVPVHVVVDTARRLAARHVRRFIGEVARGASDLRVSNGDGSRVCSAFLPNRHPLTSCMPCHPRHFALPSAAMSGTASALLSDLARQGVMVPRVASHRIAADNLLTGWRSSFRRSSFMVWPRPAVTLPAAAEQQRSPINGPGRGMRCCEWIWSSRG